jgi:hypothetical protein
LAAGCTESPHDASITDTLIDTGGSKEHRADDPGEHLAMPVAIGRIQTSSRAGMRDTGSLAGYRAGKRGRGLEHGVAACASRPDDILDLLGQRLIVARPQHPFSPGHRVILDAGGLGGAHNGSDTLLV